MTTYGNNPGWEACYILSIMYRDGTVWANTYPTLQEAYAYGQHCDDQYSDQIYEMSVHEARKKKASTFTWTPGVKSIG